MNRPPVHLRYAILASANLFAGAFGFLTTAIIGSHFGPGGLGDVALATSLLAYALIVATGGTELYAIQKVAAAPKSLGRMVSSVMVVRLGLGLVCYVVLLAIALWAYTDRWQLIALFGLSLFPAAIALSWVPQALHESGVFALANVLTQAVSIAALWVALKANGGLPAVAVSKILAELLMAGGLLVWLRRYGQKLERPAPWKELYRLALNCMPIAGTQLVRGIALGSDLVILAIFVSREETGYFAAAFKIFGFLLGLGTAYFVVLLPRIAQQPDSGGMSRELSASFKLVLPTASIVAAAIALTAAPLLRTLFGASFGAAAAVLQLLCLAWLANIAGRHYRQVLLAREQRSSDFQLSLVSCAVHIGARLALIPLLGITGAAMGMALGEGCLFFAQQHACRRELRRDAGPVNIGDAAASNSAIFP